MWVKLWSNITKQLDTAIRTNFRVDDLRCSDVFVQRNHLVRYIPWVYYSGMTPGHIGTFVISCRGYCCYIHLVINSPVNRRKSGLTLCYFYIN